MSISVTRYDDSMDKLQKKLDEYITKQHSKPEIGKMYERQIRYIYEKKGWRVTPYGILKGKADLGRDLICTKKKKTLIIQAKNWSKNKRIHEKHLMQLCGTMLQYIRSKNINVDALFISTARLSETAKKFAHDLKIKWQFKKLDKTYPMIKCNIGWKGKKRFFLPFDKYYDYVHIDGNKGEFYTDKIKNCLIMGFKYGGKN